MALEVVHESVAPGKTRQSDGFASTGTADRGAGSHTGSSFGLGCGGSPTPPSPPPPSPSTLVGEWVLVTSDRPGAPSGIGVRRKVFTQTTWSITQRDPATGDVVFHHGGTYTLSRKVMFPNSLIHLLDVRFPGQTWVTGVLDPERIEAEIKSRLRANTPPAGTPVRNTWLGRLDVHRIGFTLSVGDVEDNVDALLLLTSSSLHGQPRAPLDPTYERELMRRRAIADATLPFRGAKIRFEERVAKFEADADAPADRAEGPAARSRTPHPRQSICGWNGGRRGHAFAATCNSGCELADGPRRRT
jgi:hypothetical protein